MNMVAQFNPDESLVPVLEGDIGSIVQPVVNARELHKWLNVNTRFAMWIKERISKYEFLENEDFVIVSEISETIKTYRNGQRKGAVKSREYMLTLDMAKELSMVENNEQGKIARRYFIRCERELHQANNNLMMQFNRALLEFEKYSDLASQAGRTLAIVGKQIKPQARDRADSLKKRLQPVLNFGGAA